MATPGTFTPIAVAPAYVGTGIGTLYTAGANGAIIDYITLTNVVGTASRVASIYYVIGGGTAGGSNLIAGTTFTIPADTLPVNVLENLAGRPFHMAGTSTLQGTVSAASEIVCHIGGVDYS